MTATASLPALIRYRYPVLVLCGLLLYGFGLGTRDLWFPDEPTIGEVAQSMFHSGDWIAPRRTDEIWVDYPPMIYWVAVAASHLLGGVSEFSLRLPSALAAIAMTLAVCAAGSRWFGARAGLWSGVVLLTFVQFWLNAIAYRTDMVFTLFLGGGMLLYASAFREGETRMWPRIAGFALLGLAVLTKGPLGVLLPGLVLFLWHALRREWRELLWLAPLGLLPLAIYLPWFVACARQMGADDILHEFWAQNFQRFYDGFRGHEGPARYYAVRIWADLAAWSPLLPFACWWSWRSGRLRCRHTQLLVLWLVTMFGFFTIAVTKRQVYLLPAYAAAALLLGRWVAALTASTTERADDPPNPLPARLFVCVFAIVMPVFGLLGLVGTTIIDPIFETFTPDRVGSLVHATLLDGRTRIALFSGFTLGLGAWLWRTWRRSELPRTFEHTGASLVLMFGLVTGLLLPVFNTLKTYAPQGDWIRRTVDGSSTSFAVFHPSLGHHKRGAFQYYAWPLKVVWARTGTSRSDDARSRALQSVADVDSFFERHPRSICLVERHYLPMFLGDRSTEWTARMVEPDMVAGRYHYAVFTGPGE